MLLGNDPIQFLNSASVDLTVNIGCWKSKTLDVKLAEGATAHPNFREMAFNRLVLIYPISSTDYEELINLNSLLEYFTDTICCGSNQMRSQILDKGTLRDTTAEDRLSLTTNPITRDPVTGAFAPILRWRIFAGNRDQVKISLQSETLTYENKKSTH